MKLRYILGMILSALLFTGCQSDDDPIGSLSSIQLDKTVLLMPTSGGDVTLTVNANAEWKLDDIFSVTLGNKEKAYYPLPVELNADKTAGVYSWLTADKLSGQAGETTVTFHATKTDGGRECTICFGIGNSKQFLLVRQGSLEATDMTCAEIIAAPVGKNCRVKAKITRWASNAEQYGNMWISDGTGEVQIYGMADKDGKFKNYPIASWGLEIGDVITVEGPKGLYGTTHELIDVTLIDLEKSLLSVVSEDANLPKEGGDFSVKVAYKGSGAFFNISDEAKAWVVYQGVDYIPGVKTIFEQNPADSAIFKFTALPNEGAGRKGTIDFTSSSYDQETGKTSSSTITYTVSQAANVLPHGENPDDPFNVAEAIAKCVAIGSTTDGVIYYAKGKISSIASIDTGSYGNATFNISADGKDENFITVYRSYFLNNEKFTSEDQIAVGDEVVITGKLVNYKGTTPEFSGNVYVYAIKKGGGTSHAGTVDDPFDIASAIAFIDGGGTGAVYVKGIVSELYQGGFSTNYGQGSFYISDDGTKHGDSLKDFEAYQVNYVGNRKWTEADPQIAVGDVVIIYGPLTYFAKYSVYETQGKGAAYIYSLNGKTE